MTRIDDDGEVAALRARIAADGPRLPLAEPVLDEAAARQAARKAVADLVDERAMDAVLAQIKGDGLRLTGPGGFLSELVKAVLERGLAGRADRASGLRQARRRRARARGNSRNGVDAQDGADRGRADRRERAPGPGRHVHPGPVAQERPPPGRTVRCGHPPVRRRDDGARHLPSPAPRLRHRGVGPDTISTITDEVLDEVKAWQTRPLDEVYPIVYVDALMVKVRDGGTVRNKACYLVVGVDVDGVKHVLGIWVQARPRAPSSGCRCAPSSATAACVTC